MKQKKQKGRPPKFVLDENGKEVYGLSYNKSTRMYYATFSDPRVYFSAGGSRQDRLNRAINYYKRWAEGQTLSPEQQQEKAEYERAYIKARELLLEDKYIQEEITKKVGQLIDGRDSSRLWEVYAKVSRLVEEKARSLIEQGKYDDYIVNNIERLPQKNKLFEAINIKLQKSRTASESISWKQAWDIFYRNKAEKDLWFDKLWYIIVKEKMLPHFDDVSIDQIRRGRLYEALTVSKRTDSFYQQQFIKGHGKEIAQNLMQQLDSISIEDRLELLEEVFSVVKSAGYPQADSVLKAIKSVYTEICK